MAESVKKNFFLSVVDILCPSCDRLTFILLTWRIWWAPNYAEKWQMVFNSAF